MKNTTPTNIHDIVFSDSQSETIVNDIIHQRIPFPRFGKTALCLYGSYGTGKTTCAGLFCQDFELALTSQQMVAEPLFISCNKSESIDVIIKRCNNQRSFVSFNASGYHYFIFDEADNLTEPAQRALKAFLNNSDVICVLTTNYLQKLDRGLLDRCIQINFNAAKKERIKSRIIDILNSNGVVTMEDGVIDECIEHSDGTWRDILMKVSYAINNTTVAKKPIKNNIRIVK
ncbi:AAA family ATPase [Halomonas sp. GFAJ-1]|uniref:AAA family ATPase n=1 Tax=Halomonas sp. GFAJ-1 TaxID=1118153 RepID=UPI00023A2549|nr:AAA family ATPase [Halomonas sp. GFAJ-1]AVI62510.1 hypothetical protein BB497_07255 [Halomonas sp. GFAJ-1]EHK59446.1 ATPase AAA [Halomonas sp. GFAJ-1]